MATKNNEENQDKDKIVNRVSTTSNNSETVQILKEPIKHKPKRIGTGQTKEGNFGGIEKESLAVDKSCESKCQAKAPESSVRLQELERMLELVSVETDRVVLIGDLNINMNQKSPLKSEPMTLLETFNMSPIIEKPTRDIGT
ncbi:hypothetical protein HHI36_007930 [Cryptolaemus montrouzieri]|uniref:Uncharacterized protein n=1 Tax=Cryptolaemus montrouzieri TaxID=559131 RepID=A0ABD2MQY5_9CUCU